MDYKLRHIFTLFNFDLILKKLQVSDNNGRVEGTFNIFLLHFNQNYLPICGILARNYYLIDKF